jgi:PAS domain S-box-containing protein
MKREGVEPVLSESERFARSTLDALSAHIAILDETGAIVAVNRAWRAFAQANHPSSSKVCEGANYLAVCDAAQGPDAAQAAQFADAVRAIMGGERNEFSLEYPCHSPDERRWFNVHVGRFSTDGTLRVVVAHETVTERKLAEEALRESEERFRAIADYTVDWENWFGVDGKLLWVNPAVERITGYSVAECHAMPTFPFPLFAEEYLAEMSALLQEALSGTRGNDRESLIVCKGGSKRWVSVSWQPILGRDGAAMGYRTSVRDIAERKRAEERLRESEEKYRLFAEHSGAGVGYYSTDGTILFFNHVACEELGGQSEDFVGRSILDVFGKTDGEVYLRRIQAAAVGQGPEKFEDFVVLPSGGKWFLSTYAGVVDASGKVIGVQIVSQDISARKQAEDALHDSERSFRSLAENLPDIVARFDRQLRHVYVNGRIKEETDWAVQESLGRNHCDLGMAKKLGRSWEERLVSVFSTGRPATLEFSYKGPSGLHQFETRFIPEMDDGGDVKTVLCISRNVTERSQAAEALRASHEQLRALASRLQFVREEERIHLAREIHDVLAQELTRLKIDLVWLQRRLTKPGKAFAPEVLATRVSEMSQMADAAISCVQRIATGLRPAVLDSLGLSAAVEWLCLDFQAHSGIPCRANVPEDEVPVDSETATAAFRILQESLTNVQRHAKATRVHILLRQKAGRLVLRVQDNGCGIRSEAVNNPLSIGVSGMRERALLLGGQFGIRNRKGSGTTVEVRLPLAKNENLPEES